MKANRTLVGCVAAALLLLGASCGDDSSESNNATANHNTADAGGDTSSGGDAGLTEVDVPQTWEYQSEYSLRFTRFKFEDGTPGSGLNVLLRGEIRNQQKEYPVVVLVHLKDIDPQAETLSIRGGAGVKDDIQCDPVLDGECAYQWDQDTPDEYTTGAAFDPETGEINGELASLHFVATFKLNGDVNKTEIPINDLSLDAQLVPSAYKRPSGDVFVQVAMEDASLTGYLDLEDARDSKIQVIEGKEPKALSGLLGEETMNADRDGDGEMDAWKLEGIFTARQTTIVE